LGQSQSTDTNLPKDEEKKLVRFDVVNPETKQTETYNILEKDAARFRVQQEQQGKAIQARQAMQSNQQQFTLKHDQIAQQLKKELEDYKTADAEIKATKDQARKLELQKANEERQKNILKYKTDLESSLLNDQ
jgi:tRNA/tmRNA/rRNA uracil-C5-methylase (TrmA/RlmC/RlmD family)